MIKKFITNKKNQKEILRFVIVGVICTLIDFAVSSLVQYVIYKSDETFQLLNITFTKNILVAAISGFTLSVIANYLLSIFLVFKDVEQPKKSQSAKGFILFVVLSTIGFLINYGIKELGNLIIPFDGHFFWFMVVFGVATLVVLIYNYITRKLILFKPPKSENIEEIDETEKN